MVKKERDDNVAKGGHIIPPVLYKYMSLERFITSFDDYLASKVWFADRESLNDPMEAVPLANRVFTSHSRFNNEPNDVFCQRIKDREGQFEELEKIKICSLSGTPDNFAMWSYYADEHIGVCIGFEIDPNLLKDENITIKKVKYVGEIPVVEYNGKSTLKVKEQLFCRKMRSWRHEKEWRLLVSGKAQMLKVGKVREVLLGSKCPSVVDRCFIDKQQPDLQNLVKRAVIEQPAGKGWSIYVSQKGIEHPLGIFSSHDWQYKINEHDVSILCYRGEESDVKVPPKIHGKPVIAINFRGGVFHFCYLTSVRIPEGVVRIDNNAFECYTSLVSITIPASVQSIGQSAFSGCTSLTSVTFEPGSNVTDFELNAFPEGINGQGGETLRKAYLSGGERTYTRAANGAAGCRNKTGGRGFPYRANAVLPCAFHLDGPYPPHLSRHSRCSSSCRCSRSHSSSRSTYFQARKLSTLWPSDWPVSSRTLVRPAGISGGTSRNNRWFTGISTVCSTTMLQPYIPKHGGVKPGVGLQEAL